MHSPCSHSEGTRLNDRVARRVSFADLLRACHPLSRLFLIVLARATPSVDLVDLSYFVVPGFSS
jgi:hypothetical protein